MGWWLPSLVMHEAAGLALELRRSGVHHHAMLNGTHEPRRQKGSKLRRAALYISPQRSATRECVSQCLTAAVQVSPLASCTLCVLMDGAEQPSKMPRSAAAVSLECLLQAAETWSSEPLASARRASRVAVQRPRSSERRS